MSVLMGVFANYGYVLGKAGPFGFWTWLIVGAGQLLVALVFAEMAGRIPLTGALYNWNSKLGHPIVAWLVGWLSVFAYAAGSVGIAGEQTGVYPLATPGGWNLIGRTPLRMFDATRAEPALLRTGDRVKFRAISEEEFFAWQ